MEHILSLEQAKAIQITGGCLYDNLFFELISNSLFMRDSDFPEGLKVYLNLADDGRSIIAAKFFVEGSKNCYSNTIRTSKKKKTHILKYKYR